MISTTESIPGHKITELFGVVEKVGYIASKSSTAEVEEKIQSLQKKLLQEAISLGGNAVIGTSIVLAGPALCERRELYRMVAVTGTAVTAES